MKANGIEWRPAPVGDKPLNGQVEVYMGILQPRASAMCISADLHAFFFIFALLECVRMVNEMPAANRRRVMIVDGNSSAATSDDADEGERAEGELSQSEGSHPVQTRVRRFYGSDSPAANTDIPTIFGSDAYVLVDPHETAMMRSRTKQFGKRREGIYVGFDPRSPQMQLYMLTDTPEPSFVAASQAIIFNGRFTHGRDRFHYGRRRIAQQLSTKSEVSGFQPVSQAPDASNAMDAYDGLMLEGVMEQPVSTDSEFGMTEAITNDFTASAAAESDASTSFASIKPDTAVESKDDLSKDEFRFSSDRSIPADDSVDAEHSSARDSDDTDSEGDDFADGKQELKEDAVSLSAEATEEKALRRSGRERKQIDRGAQGFVTETTRRANSDGSIRTGAANAARSAFSVSSRHSSAATEINTAAAMSVKPKVNHWERLNAQFPKMPNPSVSRAAWRARYNEDGESELTLSYEFTFDDVRKEWAAVTLPGPQNAAEYYRQPLDELTQFNAAKKKEDDALVARGTFELVPECQVPRGARILDSRYVWTKKVNELKEKRYKARLVAKDLRFGAVLNRNYSPVIASK